jgi:Ser/Thr protein kinase RdoA (MazF antagonist)
MATYTSVHETDLNRLLTRYDLGPLASIEALKGGQANSSFKLHTQRGVFVLSICDEKPFPKVVTLTNLLNLLEEKKFPTSRVVKTLDGGSVVELNGKPAFIKTFIPGDVPKQTNPTMIFQVGRCLGQLHRIPAPNDIPRQISYGL